MLNPATVPGVTTPEQPSLSADTGAFTSLALCSSNSGLACLCWQLEVSSYLIKRPLPRSQTHIKRYTSVKFELYSFYLPWHRTIMWLICHLFVLCYFFIGLLRDIILHATGLWNYNSHRKPVLNKLLAKTESVSEYNFAASPQTKQFETPFYLGSPSSVPSGSPPAPQPLLQVLFLVFFTWVSSLLPLPPTCAFFSFHCRQSALLISWVLKEGYWHYGHLVALHRITTAHFFPHFSHLQLPQNQPKSLCLSPLFMCLLHSPVTSLSITQHLFDPKPYFFLKSISTASPVKPSQSELTVPSLVFPQIWGESL